MQRTKESLTNTSENLACSDPTFTLTWIRNRNCKNKKLTVTEMSHVKSEFTINGTICLLKKVVNNKNKKNLKFEPSTSRAVQNREVNTMTHQENLGMQQATFEMLGTVKISDVIRSMHVYIGEKERLNEFMLNAEEILLMIRGMDPPMGLMITE